MAHSKNRFCFRIRRSSQESESDMREQMAVNEGGHLEFAPDDIENPKQWSVARKCYLTSVAILLVMNATFASSAPTGAFRGISAELHVSVEATGLVTTLFLLGYVAGPLVFAPLSEFYGRRRIFCIPFGMYLAFNFLCAFTPNFAGLLVGRFLTGTFASAALSNGPGLIADIWHPVGRGNAMVLFMVATFCGPALGSVVAGFLQLTKTWRWTFYVLLWLGGVTEVLLFTVPETLPAVILVHRARRVRRKGLAGFENIRAPAEAQGRLLGSLFATAFTRPWRILFDPISFLVAIYYCVVYTLLYMLFSIYPIVFQQKRGWNAGVGELPLIGTVVGACLGRALLFYLSKREHKAAEEGRLSEPEDRLPAAIVGGILLVITVFWFAWTAQYKSIHWAVPTLAGTFLATAILLIFAGYINYLVDVYAEYAASAVAANTVARSACAAASPLFTQYMFDTLGVSGGGSLIGGIAVLLAPIPFGFYMYGPSIRERSRFARTSPDQR